MELIVAPALPSPARAAEGPGRSLVVGVVQMHWQADPEAHAAALAAGVRRAAEVGAQVVFLPELTLSRYPADFRPEGRPADLAESLEDGPTRTLMAKLAGEHGVFVHASLYEAAPAPDGSDDGLGYNTAILVAPGGELVGRTRKTHIPVTEGYFEDLFFRQGPADDAYPVHVPDLPGAPRLGLPTCWDEWFPEVARAYSLAGAEVLAYPTAIGSEPDHPDFDTQPLWQQVIVGNGITSGLFMCVPNRWGGEGRVEFYGSSFISDPYGRILAQAPREGDAVLVATLDLDQRSDWLTLFPFLTTRRPDTYASLITQG
ncbi:nitrilase-related carbon-nitrogen hydrolase [Nocardioides montaniterrae]